MRHRRVPLAVAVVASALALTACEPAGGDGPGHGYYLTPGEEHGGGGEAEGATEDAQTVAQASLVDPEGNEVGTVSVAEEGEGLLVTAEVEGLEPGSFHGFHIHESGVCQPDSAAAGAPDEIGDFLSAGGHLATDDQVHGDHAGDLPSLRALEDGSASLSFHLDSVTMEELADVDGSAFMVHAGPDNFANIPERYAPQGPDADTLATGDSGDRIACGVLETESGAEAAASS